MGARSRALVARDRWGIPGTVTPTALTLPPGLPYARWVEVGRLLGRMGRSVNWWLASWVLHGEEHYGERFSQALAETGLAEQTLLNILVVARAFPEARRRPALSFAHHEAVAAVDAESQDRWLDAAMRGDELPNGERRPWSVKRLREAVRKDRPEPRVFPERTIPRLVEGCWITLDAYGLCQVDGVFRTGDGLEIRCHQIDG